jgi:hypothetical protein
MPSPTILCCAWDGGGGVFPILPAPANFARPLCCCWRWQWATAVSRQKYPLPRPANCSRLAAAAPAKEEGQQKGKVRREGQRERCQWRGDVSQEEGAETAKLVGLFGRQQQLKTAPAAQWSAATPNFCGRWPMVSSDGGGDVANQQWHGQVASGIKVGGIGSAPGASGRRRRWPNACGGLSGLFSCC